MPRKIITRTIFIPEKAVQVLNAIPNWRTRDKAAMALKLIVSRIYRGDNEREEGLVRVSTEFLGSVIERESVKSIMELLCSLGFLRLEKDKTVGKSRIYKLELEKFFDEADKGRFISGTLWNYPRVKYSVRDICVIRWLDEQDVRIDRENLTFASKSRFAEFCLSSLKNISHPWINGDIDEKVYIRFSDYGGGGRLYHNFLNLPAKENGRFGNQKSRLRAKDTQEPLADFDMQSSYFFQAIKLFEAANPSSSELKGLWRLYKEGIYDWLMDGSKKAREDIKVEFCIYFATRNPKQSVKKIREVFPEFDCFVKSFRKENEAIDIILQKNEFGLLEQIGLTLLDKHGCDLLIPEHDGFRVRASFENSAKEAIVEWIKANEPRLIVKANGKKEILSV